MITADQALALSLDSDYQFQEILRNLKQSAKNGNYSYYHNAYSIPAPGVTERYIRGLKQLGFKVEQQPGSENIQISW